jgi:hypothetical protein
MRGSVLCVPLLLAAGVVLADDAPKTKPPVVSAETKAQSEADAKKAEEDAKSLGMSVLGNQEAPKALVLVPWKSSEIGASLGIATMLDDSRQPVDRDVFMRALSYYEIRSNTDAAQSATAAQRR